MPASLDCRADPAPTRPEAAADLIQVEADPHDVSAADRDLLEATPFLPFDGRGAIRSRPSRCRVASIAALVVGAFCILAAVLAPSARSVQSAGALGAAVQQAEALPAVSDKDALGEEVGLCTEGYYFNFSVEVYVGSTKISEQIPLLKSSTGAFDFRLVLSKFHPGRVEFTMNTLNNGDYMTVWSRDGIEQHTWQRISVAKRRSGELCMTVQKVGAKQVATPTCKVPYLQQRAEDAQMQPVGTVTLGKHSGMQLRKYEQAAGGLAIAFGIKHQGHKESMHDSLVEHLKKGAAEGIALEAGRNTPAAAVAVSVSEVPGGSGDDHHHGDILVYASVYWEDANREETGESACQVQQRLQGPRVVETLQSKIGKTAFDHPLAGSSISNLVIPAPPLACKRFKCLLTPALQLAQDKFCMGGGCSATCCEPPRMTEDLPQDKHVVKRPAMVDGRPYRVLDGLVLRRGMAVGAACVDCAVTKCEELCDGRADCRSFEYSSETRVCEFRDKCVVKGCPMTTALTQGAPPGAWKTYYRPCKGPQQGRGKFVMEFDGLGKKNITDQEISDFLGAQLENLGIKAEMVKGMTWNVSRLDSFWDKEVSKFPLSAQLMVSNMKIDSIMVSIGCTDECYTMLADKAEGEIVDLKGSKSTLRWTNKFDVMKSVGEGEDEEKEPVQREFVHKVTFRQGGERTVKRMLPKFGHGFGKKAATGVTRPDGSLLFATDGLNFTFSFKLKVDKFSKDNKAIITAEDDAFAVELLSTGKHKRGKVRFVAKSLNAELHDKFSGCDVESVEFWAGWEHTVTISKAVEPPAWGAEVSTFLDKITGKEMSIDPQWLSHGEARKGKCCITVKPSSHCPQHILDWYMGQWSKVMPDSIVWGQRCDSEQGCDGEFQTPPVGYVVAEPEVHHLEQSVSSVTVSFAVDGVNLAKLEKDDGRLAFEGAIKQGLSLAGGIGIMPPIIDVVTKVGERLDQTLVQATLRGAGTKVMAELQGGANPPNYAELIRALAFSIHNVVPTVTQGSIVDVSVPAATELCRKMGPLSCPNYREPIRAPFKKGWGAAIAHTCCKPTTCSKVTCGEPLFKNPIAKHRKCYNEDDCMDKCCLVPCEKYSCGCRGQCPCPLAFAKAVVPSKAKEKCCKAHEKPCCCAPIAACIACHRCLSQREYCSGLFNKFAFFHPKGHHRRLRGDQTPAIGHRPVAQEPRFERGAARRMLGLPEAPEQPPDRGPLATARHRLEARRSLLMRRLMPRSFQNAGNSRHMQKIGGVGQEKEIQDMWTKAKEFEKANWQNATPTDEEELEHKNEVEDDSLAATDEERASAWKHKWEEVVLTGMAKKHGVVAGCEFRPGLPCPYMLKSKFILHRGCRPRADSVNTVAVLTDTRHAVSCGSDKKCWIWNIRSGAPRMLFGKHTGSITSVVPLNDAAYILSAGYEEDGKGVGCESKSKGQAFIWQWLRGSTFICPGVTAMPPAPILSVAELPMNRVVLLGVANGDTILWNFATSGTNFLTLPWGARTWDQAVGKYKRLVENVKSVVDGATWLLINKTCALQDMFWAKAKENEAVHKTLEWHSEVYNFFHKNRMGPVNGISYVPTNLRFVTGHGDGRVRYWSSTTGQLLMCMRGHQGPVRAVVGLPQAQMAVSGGEDGTVRLWNLKTGVQLLLLYQPWGGPVLSLAVIPGGTKVAVGSQDGRIRIWDLSSGLMKCSINTFGGPVNGIAANPSNPLGQLISANEDGYVRVFNPV